MDTFQHNILAASSVFYEGECESLVVPTPDGKRGVLAHHSNAIAAISPSAVSSFCEKLQVHWYFTKCFYNFISHVYPFRPAYSLAGPGPFVSDFLVYPRFGA